MKPLVAFIPIYEGKELCQPLVTTREFGRWMEENFKADYPAFYSAATQLNNSEGYNNHPGAFLAGFFRKYPVVKQENRQRSFSIGSDIVNRILSHGLAEKSDFNKLAGSNNGQRKWLKTYTIFQIKIALSALMGELGINVIKLDNSFYHVLRFSCQIRPIWKYDKYAIPQEKAKTLFNPQSKPVKVKKPRQNNSNKGLAKVWTKNENIFVNLFAANMRDKDWPYVVVSLTEDKRIYFSCGTKDWHSCPMHKDGNSFGLGAEISSVIAHNKGFGYPEMGKYKLVWHDADGRFELCLNERISKY